MIKPTEKSVLVTGAGQRIGRAIALDLGTRGWSVAVHFNNSRVEAEEVVAQIVSGGGRAVAVKASLFEEVEVLALLGLAGEALGPITALINNASIFERDTVGTATRQSWDRHIEANLRAPFVLTQKFVKQLPSALKGCIINIIDQRVWNPTSDFTTYTLSKIGLWGLTQSLARSLAPQIRVNGIGPGPVLQSVHQSPEAFAEEQHAMPLDRRILPEDICAAVRYILVAPGVTGQMIAVDSGQHMVKAPHKSQSFPQP